MERIGIVPTESNSVEDLTEFLDAEDGISAPTELLAEFLYSVMIKDYEKALRYCTQILRYEPNNATVKEFCPLIEEKLEIFRNEEIEESSSDSSLSCSSSTSGSWDDLRNTKTEKSWDEGSESCSSLESDDESSDNTDAGTFRSNVSQTDITNGNAESNSSRIKENQIKNGNDDEKEIKSSATRTIIPAKLRAHQTQTKVLRRERPENGQNKEESNVKNRNTATLLHATNTVVFEKGKSVSPTKNSNTKKSTWFSSLQENIFGNKKQEIPRTGNSVRNSIKSKDKKTK